MSDPDPARGAAGRLAERERRLALRRQELPDDRRALLDKLLAGRAAAAAIARRERLPGAAEALSFAQERLWFLDRLEPGSAVYNLPAAVRASGRLDRAALSRTLTAIAARHDSLRTTFAETEEGPVQVVGPPRGLPLPVADLTALPPSRREGEARRQAAEEARRPFDLAEGPLARALLLAEEDERHLVLLTLHHIVADGWSMGVLIRELAALYEAEALGRLSPLRALPIQYADFARWQREEMAGEALAGQLAWWREQLAGMPQQLDLPADRPRPALPSGRGDVLPLCLGADLAAGLDGLARSAGATLFMVLLAGFGAVLAGWTGQEDLAVGSPVAGRGRLETEGLIGFFVNTLVLRLPIAGEPSFAGLLARTREVTLDAYAHQDLPFDRLVRDLATERGLDRAPLVQAVLALQNAPRDAFHLPGLAFERVSLGTGRAMFDLTLNLAMTAEGITGELEYSRDLFDRTTAGRLAGHLGNLLRAALATRGEVPVNALALLAAEERQQLLVEWARPETDYPREATIGALFLAQAAARPDATALSWEGGAESYGNLAAQGGRLARRLAARGAGPEVPVALYCERSPALVEAMLGVLLAGGAYAPLDPAHPPERLAGLLHDLAADIGDSGVGPLLLTVERHLPDLGWARELGARIVLLDPPAGGAPEAETPVGHPARAENLAYVLHTSGSTGKPKGVAVPHRGVVRLVRETGYIHFGPEEVFLQLAPAAFDVSTLEIWGPLLSGGRLAIAPPQLLSATGLGEVLARQGVTTLWLTAGFFHQVVEENLPALADLGQLLAGGDVLSVAHVERVRRELPGIRLVNGYGPTEATTFTCCETVSPGSLGGSVPIGWPIANTEVLVLDRAGWPAPIGVPGELAIGGDGLARGYWNRPDLTAESFRPHPVGGGGERLYHTGDRARSRAEGRFEFLGRLDRQVKLRGFRIEPGEIEAALAAHPGVREAVVLLREDRPGDRRLVAYVVPRDAGSGLDLTALRAFLGGRLPEFMLPAALLALPALPLNPNGKVDRAALPAPQPGEREGRSAEPPRTPTEELLAGLWSDLLGVTRVGREDEFFDLGGHSLLATRLASRLPRLFAVDLPVRRLFEAPTLAGFAAAIDQARRSGAAVAAPPLARRERPERPPLSFAQERLWFLDQLEPGSAAYNLALPLRLRGGLDPAALSHALTEVVRRHETLRTRYPAVDGLPYQAIDPPRPLPLPFVDLAGLPEETRRDALAALLRGETERPFDLARGPVVRAALFHLAADEHALLVVQHHIATDGWSLGVMIRELAALYTAGCAGRPSPLPDPALQYADFALWQRELLAGPALATQLGYWRQTLGGELPVLDLPTDRSRPALQTFRGASATLGLPADWGAGLATLGRRAGATLFMTLLAAFEVLLHRLSGQADLSVGVPIAGRNQAEIEGTLGFFINTLVLRTDLGTPEKALSFGDLLARVREAALGAYAHQDLPFDRLVAELAPGRDLSRTPLFQVFFNLLNFERRPVTLPGLTVERLAGEAPPSKFDLTVYAREEDGRIRLDLLYNADLFDRARIDGMLAQLAAILAHAADPAADITADITAIPLATGMAAALLPDPMVPLAVDPDDRRGGVEDRFFASAASHPERIAVVDGRGTLAYGDLAVRVERLARRLRGAGLALGEVVAIHARRDAALPWAVLGALAARGAFLILDPAYPAARLAEQVRLARPAACLDLTGGPLPAELEEALGSLRCRLGREAFDEPAMLRDPAPPDSPRDSGDLAYVAFTSGSTGIPKGILGEHGPLLHFLRWHGATFGLTADDRFALLSGLAHDPLLRDLFTPLVLGAVLAIPDEATHGDPERLVCFLAAQRVTVVHLTPAFADLLAQGAAPGVLPDLRWAFFGGDRLRRGDVRTLQRIAPRVRAVNFYGATETPQAMGWHAVTEAELLPGSSGEGRPLPLGRGIDAVQLLVLTRRGGLAGIGELGEIHVRTPYLARGYLGDAALTRERFLVDPAAGRAGNRLYRTGDLGRYRPDGEVDVAGRADAQLKVRGFRVEPAEIEAALVQHPAVAEAAVLARGEGSAAELAAWVVPRPVAPAPDAAALRDFLRGRLPVFLIPGAIAVVAALPRTPNGKLDRQALLRSAFSEGAAERGAEEREPPRGAVEELLAGIWLEVLGPERGAGRIGRGDDFFALGGHSLLATQVLSRTRAAFGVELPVRCLFEAPTLTALARAVEAARAGTSPSGSAASVALPLTPAPRVGSLPLSFAQERLFFLDRLEPGNAAYHMPAALRLSGRLDRGALAASYAAIVDRHESLRTVFADHGGRPAQVVLPAAPGDGANLPFVDLSALPGACRPGEARRLTRRAAARPFDLGRGPLCRLQLLRLTPEEHLLLVSCHHIVSDGWSVGVLAAELAALYPAFAARRPSPLSPLAVQYADFALWQRSWLTGDVLAGQLAYWRSRLAGAPARVELPTDRPRPAAQTFAGRREPFALAAPVSAALAGLARHSGATPFMLLLAAFTVLVSRASGQDDFVIGTPIANRSRPEIEGLIGLFANTLALRISLPGNPTFTDLLALVREGSLDAFAHQDLPFEQLVADLKPERSLAHSPLFQVLFVLQNAPLAPLVLPDLAVEPLDLDARAARFDWTLSLASLPGGLAGHLETNTDLFDLTTAQRALGHLAVLLAGIVEDPGCRLSRLPLLSAAEAHQLGEWNDTAETFPEADLGILSLHDLVRRQAARTPGAIAVVYDGRTLTYGGLVAHAGALARRLAERGVGPEIRVAIAAERSLELVVGLLAILAAGGAYVPLDPAYPADRLAYLLTDSAPAVLLVQGHLIERLPPVSVPTLLLDGLLDKSARPGPGVQTDPANLAYVLYTSGSTGQPKGAMNTHRGIVNRLLWMQRHFRLTPDDAVLQKTPVSFDVSVWELFWPLLAGARLVLARPGGHLDGVYMAELIRKESVTTLHFVPPMLAAWLETPGVERCTSLRRVIASGEALPAELVERHYRHLAAPLYNLYGPTEAAVDVTIWACEPGSGTRPVPIGRPIANTSVHLLGRFGEPVPIGVDGELLLGGVQLARGYHARPGLTAERFVPGPGGQRLYRTGDLARRRRDGAVEFLGRLDHQVKIRGVRIELGEIEAALLAHPAVGEAVVLAREDRPGERRLAAYIVPVTGVPGAPGLDPDILRAHLAGRLPEALVPAAFVVLDVLPLSPNGKVDRRALPAPERPLAAGADAEPATAVERILATLWAELLGLPRVGRDDNFFALGGDSILSLQVVARAHRAGLHLAPRDLFEHQTLARLAAAARPLPTSPTSLAGSSLPEGPVPLTPIQRWFFDQDLAEPHHFNQALLLALSPAVEPGRLAAAVAGLPERHTALRLLFRRELDGWEQTLAPATGRSPLAAIDLSALPEPRRRAALESACAAAQTGFDLTRGPLFRALLFSLGTEARLLLAAHHLVVDGVSWRVLLEDLTLAVRPETATTPLSSTTSFPAWATRLAAELRAGARRQEIPLWLDAAGGAVPPLPAGLPDNLDAGPDTWAGARTLRLALDPERTEALLHEVPARSRARVDEILLAALAQAFARWSGSPRLRLDLEGHGREPVLDGANGADLSRSVGWFTALFPVVFDLAGAHSPSSVLRAVRQRLRALPDGGIGYGLLRYLSGAEAAAPLATLPPAEVLFNYLGRLDPALPAASPFASAPEAPGPMVGPGNRRSHRFQVGAGVASGRLVLTFTYGAARDRQQTVEALARDTLAALEELVDYARSPAAEEAHVPADFPLAPLDALSLASLAVQVGGGIEDVYPLTPTQEGLLFHSRFAERPGEVYVAQYSVSLLGALDQAAFERAWEQVVTRHGVLRTSFHDRGLDRPLQIVERRVHLAWEHADWRDLAAAERRQRVDAHLAADRGRGFALESAPLLRFALLRLGPAETLFHWSFHHLLLDGWSLPLVFREVFALYTAACRGAALALPAPRPYRDYILWLERRDLAAAEAFWRAQLAGFSSPTPLGVDRPVSPDEAPCHDRRNLFLSPAATADLQAFARRHHLTLNTLVQAAWALLLARYSGPEVLFGTTTSGRPPDLDGVESMVGLFINTLPVRLTAPPRARLLAWLDALFNLQVRTRDFETTPLADVQRWSAVPRGVPLFASLTVFENYPVDRTLLAGAGELRVGEVRIHQNTNYPLVLIAALQSDRLRLRVAYEGRRFDAPTALRLLEHLATLLAGFDDADPCLGDLPILPPAERALLAGFVDTAASYPEDLPIHRLFERQVAARPDALALIEIGGAERGLTYGELDARAGRLARRLRRLGVGPESLVALLLERSLETLIALFAVLKAGAGYLPLDPAHPVERLRFELADAGAGLVLTQERLAGSAAIAALLASSGVRTLCLDRLPEEAPGEDLSGGLAAGLAYVIYTSGSTGLPKGVMIEHRSLVHRVLAMTELFAAGPHLRQLQFVSLTFDVSCEEIFVPLSAGGSLALPPSGLGLTELLDACARLRVTKMNLPASFMNQMIDELAAAGRPLPPDLSVLVTGAESPSPTKLATLARLVRGTPARRAGLRVFNVYGPTEGTILATAEPILLDPDALERTARIPIGRPLAGVELHLLDAELHPVPVGVPGELYIGGRGGIGVTRGYLRRPEATAERLLPDPLADRPGSRLYRTGDLARWLPDGRIEFLGRTDHQIKVRGFRVELGEIQTTLDRHPAVAESVVVLREDTPGDRRLVAYLALRPGPRPAVSDLRAFLMERLPEHMVPALFITLDALPVNPNGKVDRAALPAPDRQRPELAGEYAPPRTALERYLAELWQDLLGLDRAGRGDGFFELGGDSLKAAVFLNRLEAKLGQYVYVTALYDAPTLADLALYLARHYKVEVARLFGPESLPAEIGEGFDRRVDEAAVAHVRGLVEPLPRFPRTGPRNPPALFVLSPPRSGSTLLRVLLAGHPRLFAPPELDLLSFNTMGERKAAFSGRYSFWLEGAIRAVKEIRGGSADAAARLLAEAEERDLPVRDFYRLFEEWIGDRLLVDKTPSYALDRLILERAEEDFSEARFLHLVRHPLGMVHSFAEARIDQLFFRYAHDLPARELGEIVWLLSHENILGFLETIPPARQHRVHFEEMVREPEAVLQGICDFLGLDLHPDMLRPYAEQERRMTDGLHPLAKMLGDVKFHQHGRIDPAVADRWREALAEESLGEPTRRMAAALGYRLTPTPSVLPPPQAVQPMPAASPLVLFQAAGAAPPFFCVHPLGGGVFCYATLADELGTGQPFYGIEARGLRAGEEPCASRKEMLDLYLSALTERQPRGPYRLGGWSFGGFLALELARRLAEAGETVELLALLDVRAGLFAARRDLDEPELLALAFQDLVATSPSDLRALPAEERLPSLIEATRRAGRLPAGLGLDQARRLWTVGQANRRAFATYEPGPYAGPLDLFVTTETAVLYPGDPSLGWDRLYPGQITVHPLPGGHLDMMRPPHVQILAGLLRHRLRPSV